MTSPAANVLLVATNNGLFKSIDGGTNFGTAPSFTNGSPVLGGSISDLHLDTTTANTVYAAVNGSGIFQSTDGGSTWGANLFTEHQRRADRELQLHLVLAVDQPEQPDHLRQRRRRHRLPVDRAAAERLQLQQPLRLHRRRRELDRAGNRRRLGLRGRDRMPVRLRPDDRRRPGRCEQGLHRLPAALLLEQRRRGPLQRGQRQQDPLGRARDRVQSRDTPVARPRDARVGRQRRRRRAQ